MKQRNLREIAQLYGTEVSLEAIEEHRKTSGLDSFTSKCFKEARISALLIDDGLKLDKKHDIEWHRNFVPFVGRVLRIETLAEQILEEECPDDGYFYGSKSTEPPVWDLDSFTKTFVERLNSYPFIFAFKYTRNECDYSLVLVNLDYFGHACSRDCCFENYCCLS